MFYKFIDTGIEKSDLQKLKDFYQDFKDGKLGGTPEKLLSYAIFDKCICDAKLLNSNTPDFFKGGIASLQIAASFITAFKIAGKDAAFINFCDEFYTILSIVAGKFAKSCLEQYEKN